MIPHTPTDEELARGCAALAKLNVEIAAKRGELRGEATAAFDELTRDAVLRELLRQQAWDEADPKVVDELVFDKKERKWVGYPRGWPPRAKPDAYVRDAVNVMRDKFLARIDALGTDAGAVDAVADDAPTESVQALRSLLGG